MVEIQRVDDPSQCPQCDSDAEIAFILNTLNVGLGLCTGCGMLQVRVEKTVVDKVEGDFLTYVYYWYSPEAITAEPVQEADL